MEGLKREHGQLNANLDKVIYFFGTFFCPKFYKSAIEGLIAYSFFYKIEALEEKIRTEMESLNTKISTMEDGLATYSDLER